MNTTTMEQHARAFVARFLAQEGHKNLLGFRWSDDGQLEITAGDRDISVSLRFPFDPELYALGANTQDAQEFHYNALDLSEYGPDELRRIAYELGDYRSDAEAVAYRAQRAYAEHMEQEGEEAQPLFFCFAQNNSGGYYKRDAKAGISEYVIVEARSEVHAIERAEEIGIYFDGVADGHDCDCCGDRWSRPYDDGTPTPTIYGEDPEKLASSGYCHIPVGEVYCYIHRLGGQVGTITSKD